MKRICQFILTVLFSLCLIGGTVAVASAASVGKVKNLEAATAPNYVVLTWTKPSGATGYQVQQYVSKKWKTVKTIKKGSTTKAKITGLKSKKTYKFRVRAKKGSKYGKYTTISVKTVPGKVTGVTATPSAKSIAVNWTKVGEVAGYKVEYSTSSKFSKSKTKTKTVKKSASVKTTLSSLTINKTYYIRVRSYKSLNGTTHYGSYSDVVKVKTAYKNAVGTLAVKSANHNSVAVSWTKAADASGYQIEKYVNGAWTSVNAKVSKSSTSYTVSGLPAATNVAIRVRPYITVSGKQYAGTWKAVNASTTVASATGVGYSALSTTSVKITWKAAAGAKGYYVKNNGTTISTVATTSATLAIKPGTTYKITVVAYNGTKQATASSAISFTSPCAQVTGVKMASNTETSITFSWTKATGATSYEVQYCKDGSAWSGVSSTTSTSYTFSNLQPNTGFKFKVRALNKNGATVQRSVDSAIVSAATRGVTATVSNNSTTLNWTAISGATKYTVQGYDSLTASWKTVKDVTTTSYTVTNSTADKYRVVATNSAGTTLYTSDAYILKATGYTFTQQGYQLNLSWSAVSGAKGYKVVRSTQEGWEDADTFGSTTYNATYSLAPNLTHNFKVYAVLSTGDKEVCNINVLAPNLNVSDTSDASKNAQLHFLTEAINRSKYDNGHDVTIDITGNTTSSITYLSFGVSNLGGLVDTMLKLAFNDILKGTNYSINGGYLKCNDAAAVAKFCEYMNEGVTDPDELMHQTETNPVNKQYVKSAGSSFGILDDKITGGRSYPDMERVFEPTGNSKYDAEIYNGNNPSAWKNGFSSVTTTKTAGGYKVVAVLKRESKPNYHNGLVSGLSIAAMESSADEGMKILSSSIGNTTLTAEIDNECRLISYSIASPYTTSVGVSMSVTGEENGFMNIEMQMNMQGSVNYLYKFDRN